MKDLSPRGYPAYYRNAVQESTDVTSVEKNWRYPTQADLKMILVLNSSYSSSTICHTSYDHEDYSEISFVGRLSELAEKGFFDNNRLNTFFVLRS